ncbi:unnamed protein product [Eruca vesicaria subsp. sativa]|uniref:Uncharacterized protein n=1 Tax=Eruca vesicaria subsp. sativa TaxID=29727 RepID=A0ABC8L104_ERUVS|nr:unnamed protein product [Eruca vesicaria subsp. sativa]
MVRHSYIRGHFSFDKQELNEDLQQKVAFHTDKIQRIPPTPQDYIRTALSYCHEKTREGVLKFLRRVATALKNTRNLELMNMFLTMHPSFRSLLGWVESVMVLS